MLKATRPTLALCVWIERPAPPPLGGAAPGTAPVSAPGPSAKAPATNPSAPDAEGLDDNSLSGEPGGMGLADDEPPEANAVVVGPPVARAPDLSDDFIKDKLVSGGVAWLDALREQVPGIAIARGITLTPVTDIAQCDGRYDGLILVSPTVDRAHVMPSGFPRMHLSRNGSGFGPFVGFTPEETFTYVALHEFGHMFGLGDLYAEGIARCLPGQPVASVMCGASQRFLTLQADDKKGIRLAYDAAFNSPLFDTEQRGDVGKLMGLLQQQRALQDERKAVEQRKVAALGQLGAKLGKAGPPGQSDRVGVLYREEVAIDTQQLDVTSALLALGGSDRAKFDVLYETFKRNVARHAAIEAETRDLYETGVLASAAPADAELVQQVRDATVALADVKERETALAAQIWEWDKTSSGVIDPFAHSK